MSDQSKQRNGWYDVDGRKILGELAMAGEETVVTFVDPEFFNVPDGASFFGTLHDLKKVSLINCSASGPRKVFGQGEDRHVCQAYPQYVIIGDRHIGAEDLAVRHVSVLVDDAEALFPDHDAFTQAFEPEKLMGALAVDFQVNVHRTLRIGDHPMVFAFGGKSEIVSAETAIGRFFVQHRAKLRGSQHMNDLGFSNQTWLGLEFAESTSLRGTIERLTVLLRFLEIMAGRPQNLDRIKLYVPNEEKHATAELHWLYRPRRVAEWERERVSNIDLLIHPIDDRRQFETVIRRWIEMDPEREDARGRASEGFGKQHSFHPDRLVAAANMFDHLPASALPEKPVLASDVLEARDNAILSFKALPNSYERDNVLGALGRLGTLSLPQKVMHRAEVINSRISPTLSDMSIVVREAVRMRNFYVHGGKPSFDYRKHSDVRMFLTEALEFIFIASDLIDAGWNIQAWRLRYSSLSHPFKRMIRNWDSDANALVQALEEAKGPKG